jgi:hypothetical protein
MVGKLIRRKIRSKGAKEMLEKVIVGVTYRNKKNGKWYQARKIVKHSGTLEDMVYYIALYKTEDVFWVRPYNLFLEKFEEIN